MKFVELKMRVAMIYECFISAVVGPNCERKYSFLFTFEEIEIICYNNFHFFRCKQRTRKSEIPSCDFRPNMNKVQKATEPNRIVANLFLDKFQRQQLLVGAPRRHQSLFAPAGTIPTTCFGVAENVVSAHSMVHFELS